MDTIAEKLIVLWHVLVAPPAASISFKECSQFKWTPPEKSGGRVFENFDPKKGGSSKNFSKCPGIKNRICFICVYTLYNDVLNVFIFFKEGPWNFWPPKRGVFENFERKNEGLWKFSKNPPPFFQGGVHYEHSLTGCSL